MNTIKVNAGQFDKAVRWVAVAATKDQSRPILSTVLVETKDASVILIGCDGCRMHRARVEADVRVNGRSQWIVPVKPFTDTLKAFKKGHGRLRRDDTLTILFNPDRAVIRDDNGTAVQVEEEYTDGNYPDRRRIYPRDEPSTTVTVEKKELVAILKVAIAEAKEVQNYSRARAFIWLRQDVREGLQDSLCVRLSKKRFRRRASAYKDGRDVYHARRDDSASVRFGDTLGNVPFTGRRGVEGLIDFSVDAGYLLDIVKGMRAQVTLVIPEKVGAPIVVRDGGKVAIVMPVRIERGR